MYNTLHPRIMADMLDLAHERRFSGMGDLQGSQIEITEDILKEIKKARYSTCKVGPSNFEEEKKTEP